MCTLVEFHIIFELIVLNTVNGCCRRLGWVFHGTARKQLYPAPPSDSVVARIEKNYCVAIKNGARGVNTVWHRRCAGRVHANVIAVDHISAAPYYDYSAAASVIAVA